MIYDIQAKKERRCEHRAEKKLARSLCHGVAVGAAASVLQRSASAPLLRCLHRKPPLPPVSRSARSSSLRQSPLRRGRRWAQLPPPSPVALLEAAAAEGHSRLLLLFSVELESERWILER